MPAAIKIPILTISRIATADYSAKQYYAMVFAANNYVTLAASQGVIIAGVLDSEPELGEMGSVIALGVAKAITHDTNIVAGSKLTTDANGKLEVASGGDEVCAIAMEAAAAENDIISVFVCPMGVL